MPLSLADKHRDISPELLISGDGPATNGWTHHPAPKDPARIPPRIDACIPRGFEPLVTRERLLPCPFGYLTRGSAFDSSAVHAVVSGTAAIQSQ